eukprot:GFYU01028613.1.p1 GENE.GFYU01028613.1~~GFYU01028613.1.p1  ORF type:complete len:207 (-),score=38.79 GFYU01028613.1:95-649(-)
MFTVGVNATTRALERGDVSSVILCRDVKPQMLVTHIPTMCALKDVPLVVLSEASFLLGHLMGMRSIMCMGIKTSALAEERKQDQEKLVKALGNLHEVISSNSITPTLPHEYKDIVLQGIAAKKVGDPKSETPGDKETGSASTKSVQYLSLKTGFTERKRPAPAAPSGQPTKAKKQQVKPAGGKK